MSISSNMLLCYGAVSDPDEASIRPTRDPPPGRAGDRADVMLLLVQDRDRIAGDMTDLVVRRLFSAGLALEMALGLMGDHPGAVKVQDAVGDLDLAIRISGTSCSISASLIRRPEGSRARACRHRWNQHHAEREP
jgi:hypothetical protein